MTLTTSGYSDVVPVGRVKALVIMEGIVTSLLTSLTILYSTWDYFFCLAGFT